jgi:thioredoxin-like negative regulator of GroEL
MTQSQDWRAWSTTLASRLQKYPNNRELLLQGAFEAEYSGDFTRARASYRMILDSGHARPGDYNMYAWLSLFDNSTDEQAVAAAQQDALASGKNKWQYLHTLACVHAALGHTTEAHQELLDVMTNGFLSEPNAEVWYGFGRLFEQYGVVDAAIAAYRKTLQLYTPLSTPYNLDNPVNVSVLASARLRALHVN